MALMGAGSLLFTQVSVGGSYFGDIFFGLLVFGPGVGLAFVTATVAALAGVAEDEAGLASGLSNTAFQVGAALGVAVVTTVAVSRSKDYLAAHEGANQLVVLNEGFQAAFLALVVLAGIGLALALPAPRTDPGSAGGAARGHSELALGRQRAGIARAALDPRDERGLAVHMLRGDPEPSGHGPAAHLHELCRRRGHELVRLVGVHTDQQPTLAARRHGHVAADQECEAAEHLLLRQVRLAGDQGPDALRQLLVVGHAAIVGGRQWTRATFAATTETPKSRFTTRITAVSSGPSRATRV